jgi:hypothetical protein
VRSEPGSRTATSHSAHQPWLQLDEREVRRKFDREPFALRHRLESHPLLQLPRIVELSRVLPEDCVEYNAGNLEVSQDASLTPRNGLSIEETLRRIETCHSWMVLKNVQDVPVYRQLIDECLDQIQPLIVQTDPGMFMRKAFIFVSSPGAITPYHADFEYNFLLHVRGKKSITVFDGRDRTLMEEAHRERIVTGGQRNLPFAAEYEEKGKTFALGAGDGVHVPLSSPHWVRVGDEASISFSITFQSRRSARTLGVHRVNARLRRWGLQPRTVGESDVLDTSKYMLYRAMNRLNRLAGR